jgi:hypothetical protein
MLFFIVIIVIEIFWPISITDSIKTNYKICKDVLVI